MMQLINDNILRCMVILYVLLVVVSSGCQQEQRVDTSTMSDEAKTKVIETREVIRKVYETNWAATVFIFMVAGSIIAVVANPKMAVAWGGIAAGIIGLGLVLLQQSAAKSLSEIPWWVYAMGFGGGAICFGYGAYRLLRYRIGFKEIVRGGEMLKKDCAEVVAPFKRTQRVNQSPQTKKLVKETIKELL